MSVIIIVQARMGSKRLPGKVLMDISGKPMLWHIIERLKYSKFTNRIIVATSINKSDDAIEEFCKKYAINIYRGEEEDVLDRYYQAARYYKADTVVRITADCPLIDPFIIDRVISAYLENKKDFYGASNILNRTYPIGLDTEVFSFRLLEECWKRADRDYQREHVTSYIYEHPEIFNLYGIKNDRDLSKLRWTVDEGIDLKFVREIYVRLYQQDKIFLMQDVLDILEKEPALGEINKNVIQKIIIK